MAIIKKLNDFNGDQVFPITHEKAVRDSNGVMLETKISQLNSDIANTAQVLRQYTDNSITTLSNSVNTNLNALSDEITSVRSEHSTDISALNDKINSIVSGASLSLTSSSPVVYKSTATTINLTATISNVQANEMTILNNGETIASGTDRSTLVTSQNINTNLDSVIYSANAVWNGVNFYDTTTIYARYPIWYGFSGGTDSAAQDVTQKYPATVTAKNTYSSTATADGTYFWILVPSDLTSTISGVFTFGGAPLVMNDPITITKDSITYSAYRSGASYNIGAKLNVTVL